jgi:four helix bundle protein
MWARRIEDLVAFQLANEFKREVYRLIDSSPGATRDFKFKDQTSDAAAGIERALNEGFHRRLDTEFVHFLRYALASLAEAKGHVRDGVDRRYFLAEGCRPALALAQRCEDVTNELFKKVQLSIEKKRTQGRRGRRPPPRHNARDE